MKKNYISPIVDIQAIEYESIICASPDPQRQAINVENVFSTSEIPLAVEDATMFSNNNGHGQGEGGTGNRSNSSLWDE